MTTNSDVLSDSPTKSVTGGVQALRGFEFQAQSLVHYLLLRVLAHPGLRIHIERIEDALIEYEEGTRELIQCKKIEEKGNATLRSGHGSDVVSVGKFQPRDLREWLSHKSDGIALQDRLGESRTFLTLLLLSDISSALASYQGWRKGKTAAELWLRPDFEVCFPIDWRHSDDPDKSKRAVTTAGVRQKIRLMLMPTWNDLELLSYQLLRRRYAIPIARSEAALGALIRFYGRRAIAMDPNERIITGADVKLVLDEFRTEASRWTSARAWLRQDSSTQVQWFAEPALEWRHFEAGHYVERPQFNGAWRALQNDGYVFIHGHPGAGKTTLARYLAFRFLKANPDMDGHVLTLGAELNTGATKIQEELQVRVGTATLFVIEDAHLSPETAKSLARAYHDASVAGRVPSRLIVTSHDTYSQRMLTDPAKQDEPFSYGYPVRFAPMVASQIAAALEENVARTGATLPLPAATIAELADGKFGLALLISRAAAELGPSRSVQKLIARGRLFQLFKHWILLKTGLSDPATFDEDLLPVLNVTSFGISVDETSGPGVKILRDAGFLFQDRKEPSASRSLESPLTYLLNTHNKARVLESIERLFAHRPRMLPVIAARLAASSFGREILKNLAERRLQQIKEVLLDESDPLSLGEVTLILGAISNAGRRPALDLFRRLGAPLDELSAAFVDNMFRPERLQGPAMVTSFLAMLFKIDRYLLRDLGTILLENARHEDRLLAVLRSPDALLTDIASLLAAVSRCSIQLARQLFEKLSASEVFAQKLSSAEDDAAGIPDLVRYCSILYPLERQHVNDILDRRFATEDLVTFFARAGDHNGALIALRKLRKLRPRVVSEAVARIWTTNRDLLVRHCFQNTFGEFATQIFLISHLNRRVARALSNATKDHAARLVSEVNEHSEAVMPLVVLERAVGWSTANFFAQSLNRKALLQSLQEETQRLHHVGMSLMNLARVDSDVSHSLAMQLDVDELVRRISTLPLFNISQILRGALTSLPSQGDRLRRDAILGSAVVRDTFKAAWHADRSLISATFAIQSLAEASVSEDEILQLSGHLSWAEFKDDLVTRFRQETSLLYVAVGLSQIADICPDVAEKALLACIDALPSDTMKTSPVDPREFRIRPRVSRTGLSAYANSLVEVGAALRIAAALNPEQALVFANKLDINKMIAAARREMNLGRIAAFLSGLNDASRMLSREVLASTATEEVWNTQTDENESLRNIGYFANVLTRVSRTAGLRFVDFCVVRFADDIRNFAEVEANLREISDWIRIVHTATAETSKQQIEQFLPPLHEATEYDRSVRHLMEVTHALVEVEQSEVARSFADLVLEESGQVKHLQRLNDFIELLHRAVAVENALKLDGYAAELFAGISETHFELLLYRSQFTSRREHSLLTAYVTYLLDSLAARGFGRFALVVQKVRNTLIGALESEGRPLYRAITAVLCDAPPPVVQNLVALPDWKTLWERSLASVLTRIARPHLDLPLRKPELTETLPRDLSPHASNITFALACDAVLPHVSEELAEKLRSEAAERAADERVATIRWLLTTFPEGADRRATPPVWTVLRETVFRRAYLPWGRVVEAEASSKLGGRGFDLYAISSYGT
jgi:hypothetical protein